MIPFSKCAARLALAAALVLWLAACASGGGADPGPMPSGSPLAAVTPGASGVEVAELLGAPDEIDAYQIWQAWAPWYFGSDTARTDWFYRGLGRVIFERNRYSGRLAVIDVAYDPSIGD